MYNKFLRVVCMHVFIKSSQNRLKPSVKIKTYVSQTANTNVETQKQSTKV